MFRQCMDRAWSIFFSLKWLRWWKKFIDRFTRWLVAAWPIETGASRKATGFFPLTAKVWKASPIEKRWPSSRYVEFFIPNIEITTGAPFFPIPFNNQGAIKADIFLKWSVARCGSKRTHTRYSLSLSEWLLLLITRDLAMEMMHRQLTCCW